MALTLSTYVGHATPQASYLQNQIPKSNSLHCIMIDGPRCALIHGEGCMNFLAAAILIFESDLPSGLRVSHHPLPAEAALRQARA